MALQPLSIGDVLMLSQTAWKIGRAFAHGKKSAPSEFAEVEREANGLSEALKLVAETLHADGSILSAAEEETKAAVNVILESAQKTLGDLDSFVERYQILRKKQTKTGFVVERSWSESVLANYKTFKWTTEGGDIVELRNMLQMHSNTINLTMQALQSRSLSRLERTVIPMAENIASIHERVSGDLSEKIDDLHRIIMSIAAARTPSLNGQERAIEGGHARNSTTSSALSRDAVLPLPAPGTTSALALRPPRTSSLYQSPHDPRNSASPPASPVIASSSRQTREDSACFSPYYIHDTETITAIVNLTPACDGQAAVRAYQTHSRSPSSTDYADIGRLSPNLRAKEVARRESSTLPGYFTHFEEDAALNTRQHDQVVGNSDAQNSEVHESSRRYSRTTLPPPAMAAASPQFVQTPSSQRLDIGPSADSRDGLRTVLRVPQTSQQYSSSPKLSPRHSDTPRSIGDGKSTQFEKALFRNSAILCDVRCTLVEYACFLPDEPDPRYNVEMKPISKESRLCVIRRREHRENGGTQVGTSIWVLSDDGSTRLQHRLSDRHETVPYRSYFQPEKVSLQAVDGDISLRLHPTTWAHPVIEETKTTWVNYILNGENDAIAFQSAIYGRMLVGSFRTTKSTVIHEGIKGAFAFEEQFANIEMLRLWEDDGISTPGAAGGILALMHISSSFGEGWARWWINNNQQNIRIKADSSPQHARIKGIDITVIKPGMGGGVAGDRARSGSFLNDGLARSNTASSIIEGVAKNPGKRMPVKRVSGIRIEFKTETERNAFVTLCKRCQSRMLPLPEL